MLRESVARRLAAGPALLPLGDSKEPGLCAFQQGGPHRSLLVNRLFGTSAPPRLSDFRFPHQTRDSCTPVDGRTPVRRQYSRFSLVNVLVYLASSAAERSRRQPYDEKANRPGQTAVSRVAHNTISPCHRSSGKSLLVASLIVRFLGNRIMATIPRRIFNRVFSLGYRPDRQDRPSP